MDNGQASSKPQLTRVSKDFPGDSNPNSDSSQPKKQTRPNSFLRSVIHTGISSICSILRKIKRMEPMVSNSPLIFLLITVRVTSYKSSGAGRNILSSLSLLAHGHKTNGDCQGYICLFCPTWSTSRGLSLKRRLRRTYASPYYQDTTSASGHQALGMIFQGENQWKEYFTKGQEPCMLPDTITD